MCPWDGNWIEVGKIVWSTQGSPLGPKQNWVGRVMVRVVGLCYNVVVAVVDDDVVDDMVALLVDCCCYCNLFLDYCQTNQ